MLTKTFVGASLLYTAIISVGSDSFRSEADYGISYTSKVVSILGGNVSSDSNKFLFIDRQDETIYNILFKYGIGFAGIRLKVDWKISVQDICNETFIFVKNNNSIISFDSRAQFDDEKSLKCVDAWKSRRKEFTYLELACRPRTLDAMKTTRNTETQFTENQCRCRELTQTQGSWDGKRQKRSSTLSNE